MSETPRMGSSYPSTPENGQNSSMPNGTPNGSANSPGRTLPSVPLSSASPSTASSPLIPLTLIDAPSQRFYVFALYIALLAWRLYDWGRLVEDEADSLWLFLKWVATDSIFLYGLPEMHIPWLEWSSPVTTGLFILHAAFNGMLMFRVPIPIEAFLAAIVKTMYDRELSVSENRVKPGNILHNSSLIMGRQIINVLPEGFAVLNKEGRSFCIDSSQPTAKLPIYLNQTEPNYIELLRLDFDTNANETIEIKTKEVRALMNKAKKLARNDKGDIVLEYAVQKPGVYRLQRVIDDSKLEVQRRASDTLVVSCPKAAIKPSATDRCVGDLSDLTIEVEGTPPMKIIYSRTINNEEQSVHNFQSIQPENLVSPLLGSTAASTLVTRGEQDVSWGQSHSINVRLNESMTPAGKWLYSIEEVHDAIENIANFSPKGEDVEHRYPKGSVLERTLTVHDRPLARLQGCDTRNPLRVQSGGAANLPIQFGSGGVNPKDMGYVITWKFTAMDQLTSSGDHGDDYVIENFAVKTPRQQPEIHRAGLYTLTGVSSKFCEGEIKEPASCLLLNPPEPDLTITSEDIYDNCAGNSIGLLVDLDLIGTPPFLLKYDTIQNNKAGPPREVRINGLRHQLELKPKEAGHFIYRFLSISDDVYATHSLNTKALILEQDVKPPASAQLVKQPGEMIACIEESIDVKVELQGEPPFILEYEIVHDGKRNKHKVKGIAFNSHTISTGPLIHGGEYTLALATVQDKTGCKIFLKDEIHVNVRRQRPKASFGLLDGKRKIMAIEGKDIKLPLRLEGEGPWRVGYKSVDGSAGHVIRAEKHNTNDCINVKQQGVYEIVDVVDLHCPGIVETSASKFEVDWIPRPDIKVADNAGLVVDGLKQLKREVCEGDVDAIEIALKGSPPYHLKYQTSYRPLQGSPYSASKEMDAALGVTTIPMDTSKAGVYTYSFLEVSDDKYMHDVRRQPLVIQQTVNAKPSASFSKPGQSYKYCKEEEAGDEVIPITLRGVPPFYLEVDIKHQTSTRPQTVKIANVETNQYDFRIPHRVLSLGTHQVSVRKVRDSRGCQRKTEYGAPHVQVQVFDVPTVYPLESRTDYCVGDRISYTLSGTPPFEIYYTFAGIQRKAKSPNTNFRRIAEKPGDFMITGILDRASECKASVEINKKIHEMPSVKLSKGRQSKVDIHEGGQAEILFEFWGTPPFEFTYTRSTNAKKGSKSQVLETKHDISYEYSKIIRSSQEGTYEVVAIKDKFCAFSTQRLEAKSGQKLLQI